MEDDDKELAALLMRMELLPEQIDQLLRPETRVKHRLPSQARPLLENPYLLAEAFVPRRHQEPIAFVTVDHGLLPHDAVPLPREQRVARNDARRARALMTEFLRERAAEGDTFVAVDTMLDAVRERSPDDRPCDVSRSTSGPRARRARHR